MDLQWDIILGVIAAITNIRDLSRFKRACWVFYEAVEYLTARVKWPIEYNVWFCRKNHAIRYCGSKNKHSSDYCIRMHPHDTISVHDLCFAKLKPGYVLNKILPHVVAMLDDNTADSSPIVRLSNIKCGICNHVDNLRASCRKWAVKTTHTKLMIKPVQVCHKCAKTLPYKIDDVIVIYDIESPTRKLQSYYRELKSLYSDIKNKQFQIEFVKYGNVGSLYF
jgi:hypothetical protein